MVGFAVVATVEEPEGLEPDEEQLNTGGPGNIFEFILLFRVGLRTWDGIACQGLVDVDRNAGVGA